MSMKTVRKGRRAGSRICPPLCTPPKGRLRDSGRSRALVAGAYRIQVMISFTIKGTHEGLDKNTQPKARFTFRQQRARYGGRPLERVSRYREYQDHVRAAFLDACVRDGKITKREFRDAFYGLGPKLLKTGKRKVRMDIFITWGSGHHGDPENIFGAIADALFIDDKYLAGSFDFAEQPGKPSVVVKIGYAK